MKLDNEVRLYAKLYYDVREALDLSAAEYWYIDMVYWLSRSGWCTKSLDHCAKDIGISKRGLIKLRDRLLERGLLKKNGVGHLKVTAKYTEVAVNKVHRSEGQSVNLVPKPVNKVHQSGELSATKTNIRLTENIVTDTNGPGYNAALAVRSQLAKRMGMT